MIKARVYFSDKRDFTCKILDTGELVTATALGNLLKKGETIVVGDYVGLEEGGSSKGYEIHEVFERSSEIFRIIVRENKKKVTAANCDVMVILNSVSKPEFKRGIVDRFLVRAYQWGVEPLVVFNKMDQYDPDKFDIAFERDRLLALGVSCFDISAKNRDYESQQLELGFKDFVKALENKTAIFLGQSGVGKSKTITRLSGGKIDLKVGKVGQGGKGKHTTTWSQIVDCSSFSLIDSPGIRSFSLDDILAEDLIHYFPDLLEVSLKCKFRNCSHEPHVKGCAFWQGDPEDFQNKLIHSRLESYQRVMEEVGQKSHWEKDL